MRTEFEARLLARDGVTIDTWKDTDLVCVHYQGKEFAHFQAEEVLDIRLTPKLIQEKGLSRDLDTKHHPNRSPKSRWICLPLRTEEEVDLLMRLVESAIAEI